MCDHRYIAPEVISGNTLAAAFDERIDIFSFSMTLWEMASDKTAVRELWDKKPTDACDPDGKWLLDQIVNGARPQLKDVEDRYIHGRDIAQLIAECWNGIAAGRPTSSDIKVDTPVSKAIVGRRSWLSLSTADLCAAAGHEIARSSRGFFL